MASLYDQIKPKGRLPADAHDWKVLNQGLMATQNINQEYDKPEGVGVQGQILQGSGFQVEFVIQNPPKGATASDDSNKDAIS